MKRDIPQLLIADGRGRIFNLPHLEAAGMKGGFFFRPAPEDLVKLPAGSELFMLLDRLPVGYDCATGRYVSIVTNAFSKKIERCYAVAAFVAAGFTINHTSAYIEVGRPRMLPLFAYAACAFYRGGFYASAVRVDRGLRHDSRFIDIGRVKRNAARMKRHFARNRLLRHLEKCALTYGCANAQNFFLNRYEAPLPTSPYCNARCLGCISYQERSRPPATQPRIAFVPSACEISELALFHIENANDPIVSFGQGCEGEPLLRADVIEKAICLIRSKTARGTLHMNTNASKPALISKLFDSGLDSIRVSLNSVREEYYARYYKPKAYTFHDVAASIKIAKKKGGYVSLNYLTMPGFTDSRDECAALRDFIATHRVDMIQWRNLNFDPLRYFRELKVFVDRSEMHGVREMIGSLKREFPALTMGYFNPSRLTAARTRSPLSCS